MYKTFLQITIMSEVSKFVENDMKNSRENFVCVDYYG